MVKNKRIKRVKVDENQLYLPMELPVNPDSVAEARFAAIEYPIWTKNKAKLIERYLRLFCYVTKHGTYIDGFAGPQKVQHPEMWSAKLVLEDKPKRLRNFYLFELDKGKIGLLEKLKEECLQSDLIDKIKREIEIKEGDCNLLIPEFLNKKLISAKEATFCLLDQRTFECHWSTVAALARYEKSKFKIELFYFLAEAWLNRALKAVKYTEKIEKWWGRDDWQILKGIKALDRALLVCERFKSELGYKSAVPWPIYAKQSGGRVQYYMIHATDHPIAPGLMERAYKKAVTVRETLKQLSFLFDELGINVDITDENSA